MTTLTTQLHYHWWFTPERTWTTDPTRAWVAPGWRLLNEAARMRGLPVRLQR